MKKYYFPLVKLLSIFLMLAYFIFVGQENIRQLGFEMFLLSCLAAVSVIYELITDGQSEETSFRRLNRQANEMPGRWSNRQGNETSGGWSKGVSARWGKRRWLYLSAEVMLCLLLLVLYGQHHFLLLPIVIFDVLTFFSAPPLFYPTALLGVVFYSGPAFTYVSFCLFVLILYVQHHVIIREYRTFLADFEKQEDALKSSLDHKDILLREELKQNRLHFENKILAEKNRLSQALHDKLGHSVNGSIYQLEACLVLIGREPAECRPMIGRVVDTLRESMDEIRAILREEKPDKKQMALMQLTRLCESCREKYGIHAELVLADKVSADPAMIGEPVWEVILDNTFEAVSNALKYADCRNIRIQITILNQFVRCHIADDGMGCETIVEGMGLQGMKQRTREIGGTLSVMAENGFAINMLLPFRAD